MSNGQGTTKAPGLRLGLKLGLKGKSILFTSSMAVMLGLLLGGSGYYQLRKHLRMELERWAVSTTNAVSRNASYAVFTEDTEELAVLTEGTCAEPDVLQMAITDARGKLLASGGEILSLGDVATKLSVTTLEASGILPKRYLVRAPVSFAIEATPVDQFDDFGFDEGEDAVTPESEPAPDPAVEANGSLVGQVVLTASHARLEATLAQALRTTALTTLAMLLGAVVVAMLYMRRIVQPLTDMTQVARRMADGDFSREFDTRASSDEVDALVSAFGAMKESVRRHTEQLYEEKMDELSLANQEVIKANAELLQINRRKSAFLADMSHELRTPLNGIIGFSDMMNDGLLGEMTDEQMECIRDILSSGRHLLTLINDILDIAKIEAGKADLHESNVEIPVLVEEVITAVKGLAYQKNLELVVDVTPEVQTLRVDERRLKQVMLNLLSNAIKYTPEGSVYYSVSREERASDAIAGEVPAYLRIAVRDTGVGIPAEERDRVFSEFDRVDNKYSREQEGSGLGLALCKKLVELHGGTISFESEPGVGTEFVVLVPWREENGKGHAAPSAGSGAEAPLVLVIEDEKNSADVISMALRSEGYRVGVAETAADGLAKAVELHPSAITLDIRLPDQDGWKVMNELRSQRETSDIPIVIMAAEDHRAQGLAAGASGYFVKPVDRQQFLASLRALVGAAEPGTVMAIDDDAGMLNWYTRVLGDAGWTVETSDDSAKCVESILEIKPDLVVLDLMMRGKSGFEVLEDIRAQKELQKLPVMIVTAKDLTNEERERLEGGVESVLQKGSFGSRDLIRELLRFRPRKPAAQEPVTKEQP